MWSPCILRYLASWTMKRIWHFCWPNQISDHSSNNSMNILISPSSKVSYSFIHSLVLEYLSVPGIGCSRKKSLSVVKGKGWLAGSWEMRVRQIKWEFQLLSFFVKTTWANNIKISTVRRILYVFHTWYQSLSWSDGAELENLCILQFWDSVSRIVI